MEDRTNKELEMLSAYLDGELSDQDNKGIQARIQANAELNAALENLRKTRALLRQTPLAKAPRNFTLTPEMVGSRSTAGRLFGTMRFVSAMAMILFAVVVVGDLLTNSGREAVFSTAMSSTDSAEMAGADEMEMAPEAAMAETGDAMAIDLADEAMDDGAPEISSETSGDAMQTSTAIGTAPAEEPAAGDSGAEAEDAASKITGTATVEIEQMFTAPPATETSGANLDDEQARANLPPSEPEIAAGDGEEVGVGGVAAIEKGSQPFAPGVFRLVEVGLVLVAIGAGLAALVMRRKAKGN
ncbi:MAG: hypothetical protein N2C13_01025 [Chloroflexota bacterium]